MDEKDTDLSGIEDPLSGSLVVTIVHTPGEPLRVESNAGTENDLIATLVKAAITAALDSVISDMPDADEDDEDEDEEEDSP